MHYKRKLTCYLSNNKIKLLAHKILEVQGADTSTFHSLHKNCQHLAWICLLISAIKKIKYQVCSGSFQSTKANSDCPPGQKAALTNHMPEGIKVFILKEMQNYACATEPL